MLIAFLGLIAGFKDEGLSFILAGATLGALRRNALNDMERLLGEEIHLDRANGFKVYGNTVYCFEGSNSDSWKRVRGFTAAGAFLNEATALNDTFVKEVISRCSYKGARIYMDTNPENPMHTVKRDYIDKNGQRLSDGSLNIRAFHFTLFDNDALDSAYVDSIVRATPSGVFTDRDIYGKWVNAEGLVYRDFSNKLYIGKRKLSSMKFHEFFAGVDWGYEHYGAITVFGRDENGTVVLIEEHAKRFAEIDVWTQTALEINKRWGEMTFYCDSARPEHIKRFRREGIRAKNADKAVISGIEKTASMFREGKLLVSNKAVRFKEEIAQYAWDSDSGMPIKRYDDVLDSVRYAIYTHLGERRNGRVLRREEIF